MITSTESTEKRLSVVQILQAILRLIIKQWRGIG
jgi:hypothetical protein